MKRDDITVLPRMEINCLPAPHYADAIHVLAVFPPDTGEVAIVRIFAGKSLPDPAARGGKEAVRFDDLGQLRTRIHEVGGIFVLAHVENEKRGHRARFRIDRAKTLALYNKGKQLELDLADEYGVYLAKLRPDAVELQRVEHQHHYAHFTADRSKHQVACVAPADQHSFEDYEKPGTATLFKVQSLYVSMSRLRVAPDRVEELVSAFRGRARLVDKAPGFVDLEVWCADREPGEVIMVSRWRDRDAFRDYMRSPEHAASHARIDPDLDAAIKLDRLEHLHTYDVVAR